MSFYIACLQALCQSLVSLQQLKLAHVAGLSDAGIRGLSCLTGLTELCVLAPTNKAVSQGSLVALTPLRDIRWEGCLGFAVVSLAAVMFAWQF
jgi:hypothetical protein